MFDALSYMSWLEPLDAYVFPCLEIYLESYIRSRIERMLSYA
jgi:hypothetical protein